LKRFEEIIESEPTIIHLTIEDAEKLTLLGKRLASNILWWGSRDEEEREKSIINCYKNVDGSWSLTVYNAIGVISVGELQITVLPKIPIDHFLYLANKSRIFPRVEEQITSITESKSLIELIAYWFVKSSEKLLRGELLKGYNEISDTLDIVRGRIQIFQTANAFYRGNIKVRYN
jgi:5-methylcytosine-specific restriction enzyme subunit McrC